jgi:hypothetical protein
MNNSHATGVFWNFNAKGGFDRWRRFGAGAA